MPTHLWGGGWESIPYHICEIRKLASNQKKEKKLAFNQTSVSLHVQEENMVLNLFEVIGLENLILYGPSFHNNNTLS